jgi:hypothetical protein
MKRMLLLHLLALLQVSNVVIPAYCLPAGQSIAKEANKGAVEAALPSTRRGKRGRRADQETLPYTRPIRVMQKKAVALLDQMRDVSSESLHKKARKFKMPSGEEAIHIDDHHHIVNVLVGNAKEEVHQHYRGKLAMQRAVTDKLKELSEETIERQKHLDEMHSRLHQTVSVPHLVNQFAPLGSHQSHEQHLSSEHSKVHHDSNSYGKKGQHLDLSPSTDQHDSLHDTAALLSLLDHPSPSELPAYSDLNLPRSPPNVDHASTGLHPQIEFTHHAMIHTPGDHGKAISGHQDAHPSLYHYSDPHLTAFHKYDQSQLQYNPPSPASHVDHAVADSVNWEEAARHQNVQSFLESSHSHDHSPHLTPHLQTGNDHQLHASEQHTRPDQAQYSHYLGGQHSHSQATETHPWEHDILNSMTSSAAHHSATEHYGLHL